MISKTAAFKTSDDKTFENLALAQEHELALLLGKIVGGPSEQAISDVTKVLVEEAPFVIDVLSTTPTSKPRARAINGGRKKRTPKTTEAAANLGLK